MRYVCLDSVDRDKWGNCVFRVTGSFFSAAEAEKYAQHFNARGYLFKVISESEARAALSAR